MEAVNTTIQPNITDHPVIKLGYGNVPPYVFGCVPDYPSCKCPFPGIDPSLIIAVVVSLGFDISWVEVDVNMTSSTMNFVLENGTVDLLAFAYPLRSLEFHRNYRFLPFSEDPLQLMIKKQSKISLDRFLMLTVAEKPLLIISSLCTAVLYILMKICMKDNRNIYSKIGKYIIELIYYIWVMLLLGIYGNVLTLNLAKHEEELSYPFSNGEEVIECLSSQKCRMVVSPVISLMLQTVLEKLVNDTNRKNEVENIIDSPAIIYTDFDSLVDNIEKLAFEDNNFHLIFLDFYMNRMRYTENILGFEISVVPGIFSTFRLYDVYGYMMSSKFSTKNANLIASAIASTGTQDYYDRTMERYVKYYSKKNFIPTHQKPKTATTTGQVSSLKIGQLLDGFWLLLLGYTLSLATLVGEIVMNKHFRGIHFDVSADSDMNSKQDITILLDKMQIALKKTFSDSHSEEERIDAVMKLLKTKKFRILVNGLDYY